MTGGLLLGGEFEIYKGDRQGEFRFRLRSRGRSILVESAESFTSKEAAQRAIQLVTAVAKGARVVDLTEDAY